MTGGTAGIVIGLALIVVAAGLFVVQRQRAPGRL